MLFESFVPFAVNDAVKYSKVSIFLHATCPSQSIYIDYADRLAYNIYMSQNPHAVSLGRLGGRMSARTRARQKGGLRAWARKTARRRWGYSLRALSEDAARAPGDWRVLLKEFFREAALRPRPSLISREPCRVGEAHRDAYLAALGEVIAGMHGYAFPRWVFGRKRYCPYPWFGNSPEGMKSHLIQTASFPFRRRNLFIDPDEIPAALAKARSEVGE